MGFFTGETENNNSINETNVDDASDQPNVEEVFNDENDIDGEISKVAGRAWLVNPKIKAKWEVQFIWPFTLDYWVIDLEENYNYAVIGEPEKENLWILSRKPIIEKGILSKIIENTKIKGYDLSNLILTPQDPLYSKCLAQWVEDIDKQQVALTC